LSDGLVHSVGCLRPHHQRVVQLIGRGYNCREAGAELGLTHRTVQAYVQEIGSQLGGRGTPMQKILVLAHGLDPAEVMP